MASPLAVPTLVNAASADVTGLELLHQAERRVARLRAMEDDEESDLKATAALLRERLAKKRWVINPVHCHYLSHWDLWIVSCLVFTSVVTPFEVAFGDGEFNALFVINRFVDASFLFDMGLQFFLMFQQNSRSEGMRWVSDHSTIVLHYLKGWFLLDLVSILPYDLVSSNDGPQSNFKLLRIVRVLRLLKLVRVVKASRLIARYQTRISIPYSKLELVKFVILITLFSHWLGCSWGMLADMSGDHSWLADLETRKRHGKLSRPFGVYFAAMHWAVMSLTSIGYGDITPQNDTEYLCCVFFMLIGGCIWAYIIGSACGVVASLDKHGIAFRNTMDQINYMIRDTGLCEETRIRLRTFFDQTQRVDRLRGYELLYGRMSAGLRAEVSVERMRHWLESICYFQQVTDDSLALIALRLELSVFAVKETGTLPGRLSVAHRGLAAISGRIYSAGMVWGEDIVCRRELMRDHHLFSLSFLEIYSIQKDAFDDALRKMSIQEQSVIERSRRWFTMRSLLDPRLREQYRSEALGEADKSSTVYKGEQAVRDKLEQLQVAMKGLDSEMRLAHLLQKDLLSKLKQHETFAVRLSEDTGRLVGVPAQSRCFPRPEGLSCGEPPT